MGEVKDQSTIQLFVRILWTACFNAGHCTNASLRGKRSKGSAAMSQPSVFPVSFRKGSGHIQASPILALCAA